MAIIEQPPRQLELAPAAVAAPRDARRVQAPHLDDRLAELARHDRPQEDRPACSR